MRRWKLNENYFDHIDNPVKAYWLGFLVADGSVLDRPRGRYGGSLYRNSTMDQRRPYGLAVKLASYDANHLHKIASALETNTPITMPETGKSELRVFSTQLSSSLIYHEITPRKTFTASPWIGPQHLMPHYWRGVIDGDGHICEDSAGCSWPSPAVFVCGTLEMTTGFRDFAQSICGTKANPLKTQASSGLTWRIKVAGAWQVPKLLKAIYDIGGPVLDRKESTALKIIQNFKPIHKFCHLCSKDFYSRGLCKYHYGQRVRAGRPEIFKEIDMQTVIMHHR